MDPSKFKDYEIAIRNATKALRMKVWIHYSTYLGRRIAGIRVGKEQPGD